MRRYRNPSYAPESLERKLNPSPIATIPLTAEITKAATHPAVVTRPVVASPPTTLVVAAPSGQGTASNPGRVVIAHPPVTTVFSGPKSPPTVVVTLPKDSAKVSVGETRAMGEPGDPDPPPPPPTGNGSDPAVPPGDGNPPANPPGGSGG